MPEEKRCWACDTIVLETAKVCPNCEMPLEESKDEIDDIDGFLNDLSESKSSVLEDTPAIPSFDDEPSLPSFDDEPSIPSFDDEPSIPSFDSEPTIPDFGGSSDIESIGSDFDFDMPTIPDFEDSGIVFEDESEALKAQSVNILPLNAFSLKKKLLFFLPQLTYWSLVFTIISFAGLRIDNGNFTVGDYDTNQYTLRVELFVLGWISFIAMGWFFRYKSNQIGLMYSPFYPLLFLFLQLVMISIVTGIMYIIINPVSALVNQNTILTTHVYFIFYGYIISGFTFGFFLFYVGYKFYYDQILGITPIAKLKN